MSEYQLLPAPTVGVVNGETGPIMVISTGKDSIFFDPDALRQLIVQLHQYAEMDRADLGLSDPEAQS